MEYIYIIYSYIHMYTSSMVGFCYPCRFGAVRITLLEPVSMTNRILVPAGISDILKAWA